jgi:peptide/nickel transport system substrate-binding protein
MTQQPHDEHKLRNQIASLANYRLTRRRVLLAGLGLASASLLAACGGDDDDNDTDATVAPTTAGGQATPTSGDSGAATATSGGGAATATSGSGASGEPKQGGRVVIATKDEPESMDNHVASAPSSGMIYDNIYDQLVVIDPEGEIHPGLATAWENVEPTRWRVTLREGVTWHNGDPFTANDVKFHFDRIFNPDDPGRPAGLLAAYKDSEVVDNQTIDIITDFPYPLLMADLVPRWQSISTNKRQYEAVGAEAYGQNPIGTGPFKFKEWKIGESLTIEAHDDYWDGRPYLDEVEFRTIPEDSARLLALESGEIDFIYVLPRNEVERLEGDDNYNVLKAVTFVTAFVNIDASFAPFDDVNVRQAVGYAINRQEIIDIAFEGQATIAEQIVAPGIAGYNPDLETTWPFDPEQAMALLEESGWVESDDGIREKDGQKLTSDFHFSIGSRYPDGVSEIIQSNLKDIGFDLKLMQREGAAITAESPEGLIPIQGGATGLGTGNFGQLNFEHFHSEGGRNYHFLWESDPDAQAELDALVEASASEYDEAKRLEGWGKVMEFNRAQALKIPLYHPLETGATRSEVKDAYLHPGEYLRMKRVWLDE